MFRPGIPLSRTRQSAEEGQPRPAEGALRPTAAERVRTLVESKATASLAVPGNRPLGDPLGSDPAARAVTAEGDVLLLVPGHCAAARAAAHAQDADLACVVQITDVAPIAVPHRIRGRAWVAGWLTAVAGGDRAASAMLLAERHPVGELLWIGEALRPDAAPGPYGRPAWSMLRLEVSEACVDDLWGADAAAPEDFAAARADPLARHEAELLQHLHEAHGDQVRGLCALLGDRAPAACAAGHPGVVPVALDRFGLRLRFTEPSGRTFDARFDFPEPVRDVSDLRRAMHGLFQAAAG
ncbi:DUF2470 domain-containing protein [Streptomyces sp. B1866]|uniref:DUF2470 domain-containing protein n=1 Tax=Streptomyces sp. B1866 TaxID=3075431 RepID=UPI00288FBA6C|nr:DUF2470 domain-containing protein [Streptomyces sp. B1866]MDT3399210.1 DUF2470 domain-containing protein [Streptomyces sp. B1866]